MDFTLLHRDSEKHIAFKYEKKELSEISDSDVVKYACSTKMSPKDIAADILIKEGVYGADVFAVEKNKTVRMIDEIRSLSIESEAPAHPAVLHDKKMIESRMEDAIVMDFIPALTDIEADIMSSSGRFFYSVDETNEKATIVCAKNYGDSKFAVLSVRAQNTITHLGFNCTLSAATMRFIQRAENAISAVPAFVFGDEKNEPLAFLDISDKTCLIDEYFGKEDGARVEVMSTASTLMLRLDQQRQKNIESPSIGYSTSGIGHQLWINDICFVFPMFCFTPQWINEAIEIHPMLHDGVIAFVFSEDHVVFAEYRV